MQKVLGNKGEDQIFGTDSPLSYMSSSSPGHGPCPLFHTTHGPQDFLTATVVRQEAGGTRASKPDDANPSEEIQRCLALARQSTWSQMHTGTFGTELH